MFSNEFPISFILLNEASKIFNIMYVAHIVVLLESTGFIILSIYINFLSELW